MRKVSIIGIGLTKFGEHWEKSFRELAVEAGARALADARLEGGKIQALFGASMSSGRLIGQEHVGALLVDQLGLTPIPAIRCEAACASGGVALRAGWFAVASGAYDIVAVGGIEKMTDASTEDVATALGGAGDQEWELFNGATFPSIYALMARRHMHDYGTTEEQMAAVAIKNHSNAAKNPFAQYQKEITLEQALNAPMVSSPLKLFDCSPITDGAAVAILAAHEVANIYCEQPIEIAASSQASDTLALASRASLTEMRATKIAAKDAFKQAGLEPKNIDLAEVHDCFTIGEIMAIEDLGFFEKGQGGPATEQGRTALGAEISVNTSGGLKGKGHPVGATGIAQVCELVAQLRGQAGARQLHGAEVGLAHNVGGSGGTAVVHILKKS
ncbi:MAG: thiolase domain-containing protein [Candidatus Micrarchaeota archaeon]